MKLQIILLAVFFLCLGGEDVQAMDTSAANNKIIDAKEVLLDINAIPEKDIPPSLLRNCYGIAIVPNVIKVGFVLGGRFGKGIISVRGSKGNWENPFFITLAGGSLGWQIGAQSTDIILVFKSKRSLDKIRSGKFTMGLDAAVAAGPVGRQVEAGTDLQLKAEIYSYSRTRGVFAGLSLEGSVLQVDQESTKALYGVPVDDVDKVKAKPPASVGLLKRALTSYTSTRP